MKIPKYAILLLGKKRRYPIERVSAETKQVTLKESDKVFNTVSIKNVKFDYKNFTKEEKEKFESLIR